MIFGLIFISLKISGQDSTYYNYNKIISKASELVELEIFHESVRCYDEAFEQIDFVPYHYYDAFMVAVKDSNYIKAYEYLYKGALKGLDISFWSGEEIGIFNKSANSDDYWLIKDSLLNVHFNSIDMDYFNKLQILKEFDQSDRSGSAESQLRDSLNFEELILLTKEKGFPTFEKTGYGVEKATLLLWHHRGNEYPNSTQWQKIIPLIQREIEKGKIDPQFFKVFDDYNLKRR
jgi:hypothetical protein